MSRLSRMFSDKRREYRVDKVMSRVASHRITNTCTDDMLLGNLFVAVSDNGVIDLSGNYSINTQSVTVDTVTVIKRHTESIAFNGTDSSININSQGKMEFGVDDFSLDWWECPKAASSLNLRSSLQCVMHKNSVDNKNLIVLQNDGVVKQLFLSSDGDSWDIANGKYMGHAPKNRWVHWALIRCNNNFYVFRNGRINNMWVSDKVVNISDKYFTIGCGPGGDHFYGYMNKIRLTKGQALWIEEFNVEEDLFY